MRDHFDAQLRALNTGITEMGALVEESFAEAMEALLKMDRDLARKNVDADKEIDQKMKDIETLCLRLLLSQQPVAHDLRFVSAALKMVSDLERIGDQCANISEIVISSPKENGNPAKLSSIPYMNTLVAQMLSQCITAFVHRDMNLAKRVVTTDDSVDVLFHSAKDELVKRIISKSEDAGNAIDSMMVAKYLERIGDHSVNIAKWAVFAETGSKAL